MVCTFTEVTRAGKSRTSRPISGLHSHGSAPDFACHRVSCRSEILRSRYGFRLGPSSSVNALVESFSDPWGTSVAGVDPRPAPDSHQRRLRLRSIAWAGHERWEQAEGGLWARGPRGRRGTRRRHRFLLCRTIGVDGRLLTLAVAQCRVLMLPLTVRTWRRRRRKRQALGLVCHAVRRYWGRGK
ncbi:hypothetical protein BV25DRAFT_825072 [Artomyces pyxidatus]|uniref:Uncharacterized protein n=1 Tax=Artomyces pyxidatus TaxID=48021 RepID=A0ACB8SXA7_9AGAM|nr:hypothetical protein BV25DRAFT_825072 [Artomyces pyxidatus]